MSADIYDMIAAAIAKSMDDYEGEFYTCIEQENESLEVSGHYELSGYCDESNTWHTQYAIVIVDDCDMSLDKYEIEQRTVEYLN